MPFLGVTLGVEESDLRRIGSHGARFGQPHRGHALLAPLLDNDQSLNEADHVDKRGRESQAEVAGRLNS